MGNRAQQRRLSSVWQAYKADIGQQLQLEGQLQVFSRQTPFSKIRCLPHRVREASVTAATLTTSRHDDSHAVTVEVIALHSTFHVYLCPNRHLQDKKRAPATVTLSAGAGLATLSLIDTSMTEMSQGCQPFICLKDDVATMTTVATVWPTARHVLLAAKANRPVTTSTRDHTYLY
jgi:hypothetical protein